MTLSGLALFLWILPADAFYGNATISTISNTAGRAPVPITVSPSKPPMNMTTHTMSQRLSGTKPYGTNVPDMVIVPESVGDPPQVPLSCLRPDVTCTLQTTITKTIATKTVPNALSIGTSRIQETETLAEGYYADKTEVVKTDTPNSTSTGSDASLSASTTSREKPTFSYDPINTSASSTETDDLATPYPTTSESLNALSVLESALSALTTALIFTATVEPSLSNHPGQGSEPISFPCPTETNDASSHTQEQPGDMLASETIEYTSTIHASSPASTITSSATRLTSPDEEPAPHFTLRPTSDDALPKTESTSTTGDLSHSEVSLTYSPLQPISSIKFTTGSSMRQTVLAFGSLTLTAGAVSTLTQAISVKGTTLIAGGAPVTLEQGEVLSYATDGLVVATQNGEVRSMSTVPAPEPTGQDASGELPEVVQQPEPSESSSQTTSADAASTGSDEVEGDSSNGSKRLADTNGMALLAMIAFVLFVV